MAQVILHGLVQNCQVREEFGKPTASSHMLLGYGDNNSAPRKNTDWDQLFSSTGGGLTNWGLSHVLPNSLTFKLRCRLL